MNFIFPYGAEIALEIRKYLQVARQKKFHYIKLQFHGRSIFRGVATPENRNVIARACINNFAIESAKLYTAGRVTAGFHCSIKGLSLHQQDCWVHLRCTRYCISRSSSSDVTSIVESPHQQRLGERSAWRFIFNYYNGNIPLRESCSENVVIFDYRFDSGAPPFMTCIVLPLLPCLYRRVWFATTHRVPHQLTQSCGDIPCINPYTKPLQNPSPPPTRSSTSMFSDLRD